MKPDDRLAVVLALIDTGGEITPEIKQELDTVDLTGWSKADEIVDLIRESEADHAKLKGEADVATARARSAARRIDALKAYLLDRMIGGGLDHLQGPRFSARVMPSPLSLRWAGVGQIPPEYQRVKVELDSAKAKLAYQLGTLHPDFEASIGRHLRIDG
jgi:hypothetical protein